MTYEWNDIIPLFFVLLVGVPHGAADSLLAMKVYRLQSLKKLMFFLISYIVLVGMTLLAWVYYPLLSLLAFLFISALHFGLGDLSITLPHLSQDQPVQKGLIAWCHGGSLIFLMPIFHMQDVMFAFHVLSGQDSEAIQAIIYCGLLYWCIGFIVLLIKSIGSKHSLIRSLYMKTIIETVGLIIMYLICPPLWSFAIYFCCIHTRRHIKRLSQTLLDYGMTKKDWLHWSINSVIAVGLILFVSIYYMSDYYSHTLLKSVFIGLSALTVPHVVLIDILQPLQHKRRSLI